MRKITILTDLHFGAKSPPTARRSEIADILLQRAVYRLNRIVKPDIVVVAGDLIEDPNYTGCEDNYKHLADILANLQCPYIAIPGNHDSPAEVFYRYFEDPGDFTDRAGIRFVMFSDRNEENWNASRNKENLDRIRRARAGYNGFLVCLQHVNLFPGGSGDSPYNFTNAEEIINVMKKEHVSLSISGHYHKGLDLIRQDGIVYVNAPSLCESPFPFYTLMFENGTASLDRGELKLEEKLELCDWHVHSQCAYCSRDMNIEQSALLGKEFGLSGIGIAEHSGQLYYPANEYWAGKCYEQGIKELRPDDIRIEEYFRCFTESEGIPVYKGFEADCDYRGEPVLRKEDRERADYVLGAVHKAPGIFDEKVGDEKVYDEFMKLNQTFLRNGCIDILAHPFRVFHHSHRTVPEPLFPAMVRLLKETDTAAEINYHINEPDPEFFSLCLKEGIRLSFGSDSHELCEVGEVAPHLAFLEEIGFNGDLKDILFSC